MKLSSTVVLLAARFLLWSDICIIRVAAKGGKPDKIDVVTTVATTTTTTTTIATTAVSASKADKEQGNGGGGKGGSDGGKKKNDDCCDLPDNAPEDANKIEYGKAKKGESITRIASFRGLSLGARSFLCLYVCLQTG